MKKILGIFLLPALALTARGQNPAITLEEWSKTPVLHVVDGSHSKESAIILLDKRRMEYIDNTKKQVELYRTLHRIVRVNDDNGIESFNRVYLGVADAADIVDIRARTILPSGKVIDVDKKNIKDFKEKDGSLYKIFAMEGLEKGCEVEYYYTFKREASFIGGEAIQGKFPVMDAEFEIVTPERLVFELKGDNCSIVVQDTVLKGKRIFSAGLHDIRGAEEEKYAAYEANLKGIEFKLSYNMVSGSGHERLFTWNELAKKVYSLYGTYTEKEVKKTGDLIQANGWDKLGTDKEKIVAVENYLKRQFATREDISGQDAGNIEWIIKNRIATHQGIIRLYGAIYEKLSVSHQIVLASNRSESVIDKSFENWNSPHNFLLYFPSTKKFMAPTLLATRYPWINPYWGAENGLFCKVTTIGSYTTALAEVKPIPLEDYSESYSRIESSLKLNPTFDTLLVDMKQSYAGYEGSAYRAGYVLSTPEEQHAFLKELVKFGTNSENIVTSSIENADFESYSDNKPFVLHASVKANELLENAGNKILVKIGEIIGQQTEMYQEKPRQFPMQLGYPHSLERTIELVLPEGYSVRNLQDLAIHHEYKVKEAVTMGFISDYTLEKNVLKVHVLEQYRQTFYPLSEYEEFKKVINASADFNKIVLILEKKG